MNTALLFSAGRGLRLRPLTDTTPKPLCTINDIPLIDYLLKQLSESAIERVLINHAYLGDQIKRHLKTHAPKNLEVIYISEPPGGLKTGGTILKALPLLNNTPFLAINADIFTNYDFSKLECPKNSLGHLVLVKQTARHPGADFSLTDCARLSNKNPDCIFSGIACYHPKLFENKLPGRVSLIPWLQAAIEKAQITGEIHQGYWFDTGNPERLQHAREAALHQGI